MSLVTQPDRNAAKIRIGFQPGALYMLNINAVNVGVRLVKARGANLTSMACSLICSKLLSRSALAIPEVFLHLPRIQPA